MYERARDGANSMETAGSRFEGSDSSSQTGLRQRELTNGTTLSTGANEELPGSISPTKIPGEIEHGNGDAGESLETTAVAARPKGRVMTIRVRHPGTLELLSQSVREAARKAASEGTGEFIYDNLNIFMGPVDEVLGKTLG